MRVAQQARLGPLFDIAAAAAHFHAVAGDFARIAAGAELDERGKNARQRRIALALIGGRQRLSGLQHDAARLFGPDRHLGQLPAHQRHVDEPLAEGPAVLRHEGRLGQCTAHQAGRAHAVGQARVVDHVGHLLEALAAFAHQPGARAFHADLAAGHGAGAQLVLQSQDAIVVVRPVGQVARQQKERHARQARRVFAARQHHGKAGVGVGAEPFVAAQQPAAVGLLAGHGFGGAHVRARGLFGHEHGALAQFVEVLRDDLGQHFLYQRGVAELAQRTRQRVGHADRAAQAELGLHEEIGQQVLGRRRHGLGPAQHAAAMRQRGQAELAVGQAFHLDISGMLVDARLVRAGAAAHRQRGRVLVGNGGQLVQPAAGQRAQAIEVRRQVAIEIGGQIALGQSGGVGVGPVQVQAARIGDGGGIHERGAPALGMAPSSEF